MSLKPSPLHHHLNLLDQERRRRRRTQSRERAAGAGVARPRHRPRDAGGRGQRAGGSDRPVHVGAATIGRRPVAVGLRPRTARPRAGHRCVPVAWIEDQRRRGRRHRRRHPPQLHRPLQRLPARPPRPRYAIRQRCRADHPRPGPNSTHPATDAPPASASVNSPYACCANTAGSGGGGGGAARRRRDHPEGRRTRHIQDTARAHCTGSPATSRRPDRCHPTRHPPPAPWRPGNCTPRQLRSPSHLRCRTGRGTSTGHVGVGPLAENRRVCTGPCPCAAAAAALACSTWPCSRSPLPAEPSSVNVSE